ncbi:Abhydrolase-3 domain-containing protein [Mycena indigotica]|uniref:Abhydrolase-3 domain-containing protein n=1 Tax=Mycena indigotica TaxID=2126181 RepID=A0A8H6W126_9AGAR|nr:Abhydrolase-3 domain-containing protein [Mycena indigotica]KAF7301082.1 Abhydrolase-3 domain-containing protein [Mycena indigotica]
MSQYAYLSEPDPELVPILQSPPPPPPADTPAEGDVEGQRIFLTRWMNEGGRKAHESILPKESEYTVKDYRIPVENGEISVRSVVPTPTDNDELFPLLFWAHGGGWVAGDLDTDDYPLRAIAHEIRVSVVSVDYRLAPVHRHPTQVNDSYTALKWASPNRAHLSVSRLNKPQAVENAPILRADVKKGLVLGGISAGAHVASVLAHRARDDPFFSHRPVTGHLLQVPPSLHYAAQVPEEYKCRLLSMEQNKLAPILTAVSMKQYWDSLAGDASPSLPEISPLLAAHAGLSPAVLQICGMDPLRDEAFLYNDLLVKAGVNTQVFSYPGLPHGFSYIFPDFVQAHKWNEDYRVGLRWLLAGTAEKAQ